MTNCCCCCCSCINCSSSCWSLLCQPFVCFISLCCLCRHCYYYQYPSTDLGVSWAVAWPLIQRQLTDQLTSALTHSLTHSLTQLNGQRTFFSSLFLLLPFPFSAFSILFCLTDWLTDPAVHHQQTLDGRPHRTAPLFVVAQISPSIFTQSSAGNLNPLSFAFWFLVVTFVSFQKLLLLLLLLLRHVVVQSWNCWKKLFHFFLQSKLTELWKRLLDKQKM